MRTYAKASQACAAFLEDIRAVYTKHNLALIAYDGSALEVVELPFRWHGDSSYPLQHLEHALDGRGTR